MKPEEELLEQVKFLLDETDYCIDMKNEIDEELYKDDEEMRFFLHLYTEYNRKNVDKGLEIKKYEKELNAIIEKQERLNGRITKKDSERKKELIELIENLKIEKENDKKNRIEAKKGYDRIMNSNPSYDNSRRINAYQDKIDENKAQLQAIYDESKKLLDYVDKAYNDNLKNIEELIANGKSAEDLILRQAELKLRKDNVYKYNKVIVEMIEERQILDIKEVVQQMSQNVTQTDDQDVTQTVTQEPAQTVTQKTEGELTPEEYQEKMERAVRIAKERDEEKKKAEKAVKEADQQTKEAEKESEEKEEIVESIFVDESRIDKQYSYLNSSNAKNLGYLNDTYEVEDENKKQEKSEKDNESVIDDQEPAKEAAQEPAKDADQEPAKEAAQEPAKDADQEPAKDAAQEPAKDAAQEPAKDADQEPAKEAEKELTPEEYQAKMERAVMIAKERDEEKKKAEAEKAAKETDQQTKEAEKEPEEKEVEKEVEKEDEEELNDSKAEAIKEVATSAKTNIANFLGKIKNVTKAPKHINDLLNKMLKSRRANVNAGTQESLDEPQKTK